METKEFATVHLNNLKIDDLFSLTKSTIAYATPVKESLGQMPSTILARLMTDNSAMEALMNKALKNGLTPQLTEMNVDRESRFAEVKRNVTNALKGRNAEKKEAAQGLKIFLDSYWDTDRKALDTQTGLYGEMMGKYKANPKLKSQAAIIGIDLMMAELEVCNTQFGALYQTRNEQEASVEGPSATSMRTVVTKSYDQFCIAVEQAVNYTPSDSLTLLFNQLDKLRKTYARLIHTEEEEPEQISTQAPAQ